MNPLLTSEDVRVLGALVEKSATTPDSYPLSLNALMNACNQSSNRDPVVAFTEETILAAIQRLRHQSLVRGIQRSDSRVTKYEHLIADTLNLTPAELAVLCVLMLRGPNTVAEVKTRSERLTRFETLTDVELVLTGLIDRMPSPLAMRLPRKAGQKEIRYVHLLSGEPVAETQEPAAVANARTGEDDRLAAVESAIAEMRAELAELKGQLEVFKKQFE